MIYSNCNYFVDICTRSVILAGCNDYSDGIASLISDASLSVTCYMTSTSSVVELTCPMGYTFEGTNSTTVQTECVCTEYMGYPSFNGTCLCMYCG